MGPLEAMRVGLTFVIRWIGSVVTSLVKDYWSLNGLLPLFAVGVAISFIFLIIKLIRKFIWGA